MSDHRARKRSQSSLGGGGFGADRLINEWLNKARPCTHVCHPRHSLVHSELLARGQQVVHQPFHDVRVTAGVD